MVLLVVLLLVVLVLVVVLVVRVFPLGDRRAWPAARALLPQTRDVVGGLDVGVTLHAGLQLVAAGGSEYNAIVGAHAVVAVGGAALGVLPAANVGSRALTTEALAALLLAHLPHAGVHGGHC